MRLISTAPIFTLFFSASALAAPNEIKVFTDELAEFGETTTEIHFNSALPSRVQDPPSTRRLQVMPEVSYGFARHWEASLQLPVALESENWHGHGARSELQYVAPHDSNAGVYWGFNTELAYLARPDEPRVWSLELQPILGWRIGRWHLAANPGLQQPLSGPAKSLTFESAAKAAYRVGGRSYVGTEYYLDAGPLRHWLPARERSQVLYAVWDHRDGELDINLGIGRGLTPVSDRWVLKLILELSFK